MKLTLFLMVGYPGAGKTTVAQLVSELKDAVHLWADHERKQRYGEPSYSQEENDELYGYLNKKAEQLLSQGKSVMYDTAFNHYEDRKKLTTIADNCNAQTIILWVQTPREIAKHRATVDTKEQPTRILNDTNAMHHEHFEYLSDKMEEPQPNETVIELDGTRINEDYIAKKLDEIKT